MNNNYSYRQSQQNDTEYPVTGQSVSCNGITFDSNNVKSVIINILKEYVQHLQVMENQTVIDTDNIYENYTCINEYREKWIYIRKLLYFYCNHEWISDHFEVNNEMTPITYCTICDNTKIQ